MDINVQENQDIILSAKIKTLKTKIKNFKLFFQRRKAIIIKSKSYSSGLIENPDNQTFNKSITFNNPLPGEKSQDLTDDLVTENLTN
ncbi:MAG: hypothetical protein ACD_79C00270G0010 [uncultured bacterium]|nr:MAG: hypothetical protein ACD_79C00270G0010 [uncultured bacterium]